MKSTPSLRFSMANKTKRLSLLTLVSLVAVAALLSFAVSANRANRAAKARAELANTKSAINPTVQNDKQPLAPNAAIIVGTLTDNVAAATKVAPGGTINYTATITNNGAASPADDASNLNFSAPLDINTTLVAGSVHASPLASNDTYNWVGNTQLDTVARALPSVTANDVAVNAPAGTDTFTVTAIAGGATALGGVVTLASPSGSFVYTPPLNRPTLADGATVQDNFTYTITNSADPTLTATGTVRINLTGRVFYLLAGAAGDGRSNTPSGNPATMSANADKPTDVFYIFSSASALNGPFTVEAGQQLLGQGVNLVVSAITLFNAAAPTPSTTNTAGSCVSLSGAPGNNTVSGFDIGNCTGGTAIVGANVGTLTVSTMSINTNGGGLDLTGSGVPTVSVVLGGLTSTGGVRNVQLAGLNGTITLAGGALSGASNNAFDVSGAGNAVITYSGTIGNTTARSVSVVNKSGGSVSLSGAITGSNQGIVLTGNAGATLNFTGGISLSTGANAAFTATGAGPAATTGGTVNVTQNNTSIVNTLTTTTGAALNVANTTIGASGLTFRSITSNGAVNGIIVNNTGTTGSFVISGNGSACTSAGTCTGGAIQASTGDGVVLTSTQSPSLTRLNITDSAGAAADDGLVMTNIPGTVTIDTCAIINSPHNGITVDNNNTNMAAFNLTNTTVSCASGQPCQPSGSIGNDGLSMTIRGTSILTAGTVSGSTFSGHRAVGVQVQANDTGRIGSNAGGVITAPAASNSITVQSNTFTGNGQGVDIDEAQLANMSFQVLSNTVVGKLTAPGAISSQSSAVAINAFTSAGAATGPTAHTFVGKIDSNIIGTQGVKDSGSGFGSGIRAVVQGNATQGVVSITNNTIREVPNADIITAIGQNGAATTPAATARFRITGNNMPAPSGSNLGLCGPPNTACASNGIFILADEASPVCNVITGNTVYDVSTMNGSFDIYLAERAGPPAGAQLTVEGTGGSNSVYIQANNTLTGAAKFLDEGANTSQVGLGACGSFPAIPNPGDDGVSYRMDSDPVSYPLTKTEIAPVPVTAKAVAQVKSKDGIASVLAKATPKASAAEVASIYRSERPISHHAVRKNAFSQEPNAPTAGEIVTLNTITTFPAGGKSITIKYSATVNTTALTTRQATTQGTITANAGAINVVTSDPGPPAAGATVTLLDTTITWTGDTSTDWNDAANWDRPVAVQSSYAPGVSNPAVNDVIIPNVGAQPTISATDIGIYSLNISNGRTLTITNPRVLTIGFSPGGDLTLDGIISGGNLNLGTGTHVINNAGGTGSLSATNVATVLSGGIVTLNNNLQAGALGVNAGGSMTIATRTLSLNGSGGALVVPGGATFTTTGSTVIFNGTAAQQAAGVAYNNLTINNTIGTNVTGVTLTGNATVNGVLALTSSDLATGAFTLTQPNTTASTGVSDVVGTVMRTGGPFAPAVILTFGNPSNQISFGAAGTKPTTLTVVMAKSPPATYAAAVQRNYTISLTGTNTSTSTVRLHYLDSEVFGFNTEATLNLRRFRTADSHWVAQVPGTVDTTNNWVESATVAATDLATQWTFASLAPTASGGSVTGRIVDDNGAPVEGAVVRLNGTQNRKFITDANGFYRFDNVETNGFYTVTPSRANYSFTPSVRSFSQLGESTEATFGATLSTSTLANPLDTPEYFVRQHYVDFLNREPDEAGFNFWSDQIIECGLPSNIVQNCIEHRRENVSAAFFLSIEFQRTGGLVDGVYRAAYGARPDFAHFLPDTRTVGNGVRVGIDGWEAVLATNTEAFVNSFVNRAEFHAAYDNLSNADYVDTLISHTGVSFTAAERDALLSGLGAGSMTRAEALRSIAENGRFVSAKFNETFVMMEYFGYLRRDADASGFAFWLNKLNQFNGNFEQAEMVKAFIVSGEYRDRFPR